LPTKNRKPKPSRLAAGRPAGTAPDWLYHRLLVSGPEDRVDAFAVAARGAGVIPWRMDFAALEEDIFIRAVAVRAGRRSLTVQGCRILARQFRAAVEQRQARARALVGASLACPFDLQTLLPIPAAVLALGPLHPAALDWLARHWGVSDGLRQVAALDKPTMGRRLLATHKVAGWGFFTQGETPSVAVDRIAAAWPGLRFVLQPRPGD
jgi:hypothetical protein